MIVPPPQDELSRPDFNVRGCEDFVPEYYLV